MTLKFSNEFTGQTAMFVNVNDNKEVMDRSEKNKKFILDHTGINTSVELIFYDTWKNMKNHETKICIEDEFAKHQATVNEEEFVAIYFVKHNGKYLL